MEYTSFIEDNFMVDDENKPLLDVECGIIYDYDLNEAGINRIRSQELDKDFENVILAGAVDSVNGYNYNNMPISVIRPDEKTSTFKYFGTLYGKPIGNIHCFNCLNDDKYYFFINDNDRPRGYKMLFDDEYVYSYTEDNTQYVSEIKLTPTEKINVKADWRHHDFEMTCRLVTDKNRENFSEVFLKDEPPGQQVNQAMVTHALEPKNRVFNNRYLMRTMMDDYFPSGSNDLVIKGGKKYKLRKTKRRNRSKKTKKRRRNRFKKTKSRRH